MTNFIIEPVSGEPESSGTHVYGYDGSGNLITDTWTNAAGVFVKTYSYTSGNLSGESKWVKQ